MAGSAFIACGNGGSSCIPSQYNLYGQPVFNACLGTPGPPGPYVIAMGICPGTAIPTPTPSPAGTTAPIVPTPVVSPCPAPGAVTVPPGCQVQFHAVAQFSNGYYSDVTNGSNWTTSNSSAVAIAVASPGLYSAISSGDADISAVAGNIVASPIPITVQPNAACPPLGTNFGQEFPAGSP